MLCYVGIFATVVFYISHTGLVNRLPPEGKVGRRNAGSDEGERLGFPSVGYSPTGPMKKRDSATPRHFVALRPRNLPVDRPAFGVVCYK